MIIGHFVGYDIKSKGYWIYWPTKRSITVERNVVINQNDVHTTENLTIILGDALAEGERDKYIQSIIQNPENIEDPETQSENETQPKEKEETNDELDSSNTIPFPSQPVQSDNNNPEQIHKTQPQPYG